jgi:hypothetical protein
MCFAVDIGEAWDKFQDRLKRQYGHGECDKGTVRGITLDIVLGHNVIDLNEE